MWDKVRKECMSTSFENYNIKTTDQVEKKNLPPILLLVTSPDEIFQEIEFKDSNSFFSGADIFIKVLEKSGMLSDENSTNCLLYTSPSPRDRTRSRMPSSA